MCCWKLAQCGWVSNTVASNIARCGCPFRLILIFSHFLLCVDHLLPFLGALVSCYSFWPLIFSWNIHPPIIRGHHTYFHSSVPTGHACEILHFQYIIWAYRSKCYTYSKFACSVKHQGPSTLILHLPSAPYTYSKFTCSVKHRGPSTLILHLLSAPYTYLKFACSTTHRGPSTLMLYSV